jgi:hypothetical protein
MYAVEQQLRRTKAGPALRAAVRQHQSAPVMARLRKAMELIRRKTLPQGLLGKAIDYMLVLSVVALITSLSARNQTSQVHLAKQGDSG